MKTYREMTTEERKAEYHRLQETFAALKSQGLALNMARGKPGPEQVDLVFDIFSLMQKPEEYTSDGIDVRNYGELSGIPAARRVSGRALRLPPPAGPQCRCLRGVSSTASSLRSSRVRTQESSRHTPKKISASA